jgi:hypothetical protein
VIAWQVPASTILLNGQSMAGRQMASDHQAAPTAFETDHVITMNGSPDRHRGSSLAAGFWWLFTDTCEGLMNSRDQGS